MKQTLEDLILENRDQFDEQSLPADYLPAFEQRLVNHRRRTHRTRLSIAIPTLAAAVVALVIVLTIPQQQQEDVATNRTLTELQQYYDGQQQRTIAIIEKLLDKVDEQTRTEIRAEIAQMKQDDKEFRSQLSKMIQNEQYIAYEVEYYRTRQSSLDYIQSILQQK